MIDLMKRLAELDAKKSNNVKQGVAEDQTQLVPGKFYVVTQEYGKVKVLSPAFDNDNEAEAEKPDYGDESVVAQWNGKNWNFDYMMEQGLAEGKIQLKAGQFYVVTDGIRGVVAVKGGFDDEGEAEYVKAEYVERTQAPAIVAQWTGKDWDSDYMMEQGMAEGLDECGIMPASSSMGMPRTPASISITADSGSELSAMLRDIASLAGIKNHHDGGDDEILPGNGSLEIEPLGVEPTDMGPPEPSMRSMIDKLNPSDERAEETIDSEPNPELANQVSANQDPAGTPGAAQGRNQMNNPVATPMPTEDEVYEALRQDYQTFLTDSYRGRSSLGAGNREFKRDELEWELRHEKNEPYRPTSRKGGMYFYNVPRDKESETKALKLGLNLARSGKWYSYSQNSEADELFGKGRYWEPKNEGEMRNTSEVEEDSSNSIEINGKEVDSTSIEVDGVDPQDYPDFSDAYLSVAVFMDGTPLNDEELDQLNNDYPELINDLAYDSLHENEMNDNPSEEVMEEILRLAGLAEAKKPSAGLSKKKKSKVVKKAKKGGDIGKPGKGFKEVEKAAKKGGAKDPKAVAAAAMWKNVKR